jgi:hypothetical protein
MKNKILIPTFQKTITTQTVGGPASLRRKVKDGFNDEAKEMLATLEVDNATLDQCINSARALVNAVREKSPDMKPETISIQLGISTTGKVGFLGTGIDLQVAAVIQLTLKVS